MIFTANNSGTRKVDTTAGEVILGMKIIGAIVAKLATATATPEDIHSGILQISYFYNLLPTDWKEKASTLFRRLWDKHVVVISTEPDNPKNIYEPEFKDKKLSELYNLVSVRDAAVMNLSNSILNLINRGLHSEADGIRKEVKSKYKARGTSLMGMILTNDISYYFDELEDDFGVDSALPLLNSWIGDYTSISLLVSPQELDNENVLKNRFKQAATALKKKYILTHMSGDIEELQKMVEFVVRLKQEGTINYKEMHKTIARSGFNFVLHIRINF